jgi:hypothetical protein
MSKRSEKVHNQKDHSICSQPNIIIMINSTKLMWVWYVASMGEDECIQDFGLKIQKE